MNSNAYPNKRRSRTGKGQPLPADLQTAPLSELFWGRPETTLFEEATQRLANALNAAVAAEPLQLFDDLYEGAPC